MLGKLFKKKAAAAEKDDAEATEKPADAADGGEAAGEDAPKKRFGKKFILIAAGGAIALIAAGAGAYVFLFAGSSADAKAKTTQAAPIAPPQLAFYDVPDIIVNIQTPDGTQAYLKLSLALELTSNDEKVGLKAVMPRVIDQFQGYLRELRLDDLKGSAGVLRVKEELLRRVNVAAAPFAVKDVLLKEMIVQ
jgi:flagellar FliL protein